MKLKPLNKCKIIEIPKIKDVRGNLSVIEKDVLPFEIKRVYYLYDVPSDASRGGHAHKEQFEFLIPLSGSFNVNIKTTNTHTKVFTLNKPNQGLFINNMVWRDLNNFSAGAVCLVIASDIYIESDYIRDYEVFLSCLKP